MKDKGLGALILSIVILFQLAGCKEQKETDISLQQIQTVSVAVLYSGNAVHGAWNNVYEQLQQSLAVNLTVDAICVDDAKLQLGAYDIIYPDISITLSSKAAVLRTALTSFVENGGAIFLENGFYSFFDVSFFGVTEFKKLNGIPTTATFPEVGQDLVPLQNCVRDFLEIYPSYLDHAQLASMNYGRVGVLESATPLVSIDDYGLYFIHAYGQGTVFFTNPLLPNTFSIDGFSMQPTSDTQTYFSPTTSSFNAMLRSGFASYISRLKYGYSVERVFGSFAGPAMSWQVHYEDVDAIKTSAATSFLEECKKQLQIPSFRFAQNVLATNTWYESITYLENQSEEKGAFSYLPQSDGVQESSGVHVVMDGFWFHQNETKIVPSVDIESSAPPIQRAYPYIADVTNNGVPDMICGSADGKFYYYKGVTTKERFQVAEGKALTQKNGEEIFVSAYSSPVLFDLDGDGRKDLLTGAPDGNIYWFRGNGDLTFEPQGILIETQLGDVQSFLDIKDMDKDGRVEIVVGSDHGNLIIYKADTEGDKTKFQEYMRLDHLSQQLGSFIAPRIVDLDGDGIYDIAAGTQEGYVAKIISHDDTYSFGGFFDGDVKNADGNQHLKFGSYAVPFFYDLNKDGKLDLIVGHLEYGQAYPIDSPFFPWKEKLQEQVAYLNQNGIYAGLQLSPSAFRAAIDEPETLSHTKKTMEDYGLDMTELSANIHMQAPHDIAKVFSDFDAEKTEIPWSTVHQHFESGIHMTPESIVSFPFYLQKEGKPAMLMMHTSSLLYNETDWWDMVGRNDVPISLYYECTGDVETQTQAIETVSEFISKHGYNFVMENQLAKIAAAAYGTHVSAGTDEENASILIAPSVGEKKEDTLPIYDPVYGASIGVRVRFAEQTDTSKIRTDADVWYWRNKCLYIGLNKTVRIYEDAATSVLPHIVRINLPATIEKTEDSVLVSFQASGMQQIEITGEVEVKSKGWKSTQVNGNTILTYYGDATELEFSFPAAA